jgi:DNA-binding response OmpR family regulator
MKTKGTILVIEDNLLWQKELRKVLEKEGYFVDIESRFENAIIKVKEKLYHFITIDMQLNKKTLDPYLFEGWDLLKIIKKLKIENNTPVLVLTAFEKDYGEQIKLNKLESIFFMGKGEFDPQKLINIINKSIEKIELRFKDDHIEK